MNVALVASAVLALFVTIETAGAQSPDPRDDVTEAQIAEEMQDIAKMLRDDDRNVAPDYGYGPGVAPPSQQGAATNAPARRDARGAGAVR